MTPEEKLEALKLDLVIVTKQHGAAVVKYSSDKGPTKYFFKLQIEDVEVNIEDVFAVVNHA